MSEVGNFFNSMPFFTRYWFILCIAFPIGARFGLLSPSYLVLEWNAFFHKFQVCVFAFLPKLWNVNYLSIHFIKKCIIFQIWRPITAAFYFPLGPNTAFAYMMNLYFLYNYSIKLETGMRSFFSIILKTVVRIKNKL